MNKTTLLLGIAGLGLASTGAMGQTLSSFFQGSWTGITVNKINATTYNVGVGLNPTVTVGANTYQVTDVFGFWNISIDDDFLVATGSNFSGNFGPWNFHRASNGVGDIAGFKANPNNGITVGGNETFVYSGLTDTRAEQYGFHVRINGTFGPTGGNTFYVTVPAPGAAALAGVGGLMAMRRRRR